MTHEHPILNERVKRRRRGLDWTVLIQLVALIPSLLVGLGIVMLLATVVLEFVPHRPGWVQWLPLGAATGWFLLGFLLFAPFAQGFMARHFFKFREPVLAERSHMSHPWGEVLRRAGIPTGKYRLWVEDNNELNAGACGGNIVSITRGAMRYQGEHLGAIMAHELGHRINGHTYPGLLAWWYSQPLAIIKRIAWSVLRVAVALLRFISYLDIRVALVGYLAIGAVYFFILFGLVSAIIWAWRTFWPSVIVLALAWVLSPVIGRMAEHRADRTAVQLGYGDALVAVFREWQAMGADEHSQRSLRALWTASHPPLHSRIRRIEKRLSTAGNPSGRP